MRKSSLSFLLAITFFTITVTLVNDGPKDEIVSSMIKDDDSNDEEWRGLIRNWTENNPSRTESINTQADENVTSFDVEFNYLLQANNNYLFKTNYYAGGLYRGITLRKYYLVNMDD